LRIRWRDERSGQGGTTLVLVQPTALRLEMCVPACERTGWIVQSPCVRIYSSRDTEKGRQEREYGGVEAKSSSVGWKCEFDGMYLLGTVQDHSAVPDLTCQLQALILSRFSTDVLCCFTVPGSEWRRCETRRRVERGRQRRYLKPIVTLCSSQ
jgi:hypothetical protein